MPYFQYAPELLARYPNIVGGMIWAQGVRNPPAPDDLQELYAEEQKIVIGRIGSGSLSEIPALAAWRSAFRGFGVDPTQYRCAAESLLRRLTKKGDIPFINTLVDIGNLVSIRYALPIAIVDFRDVAGGLTAHFADGSEPFVDLHETEVAHPEPGEVVFTDNGKHVVARRWCWRQSSSSAANEATTNCLITIEAHHLNGDADVRAAVNDILALLAQYAGGTYQHTILNTGNPVFG
jgi:DNA/RNA-binding domain of Phe-tRNA-synthetase-like protein